MEQNRTRDILHTDLAIEIRESYPGDGGEIPGVAVEEYTIEEAELHLTRVEILDEQGAQAMGKPIGTYLTLEADFGNYEEACAEELAKALEELLPDTGGKLLTVGLGNRELTADSLGPLTTDRIWVTGHLVEEGGMCALAPGVMAQTGMETADTVKGVVEQLRPEAVIVVDALAARSSSRLGRTIQLTDTGICPGSGVGNHRNGLTQDSLGIPVIAVGVPMVVSGGTIAADMLKALEGYFSSHSETQTAERIETMSVQERQQMVREFMGEQIGEFLVTPKHIDELAVQMSSFLAEGINRVISDRVRWEA